jgi:two-component system, OmpR family, phosphate regulon response regulator PhoB
MASILVVVSDPAEARTLEAHLRDSGHAPRTAAGGQAGISTARASAPDILLLDWALPDMSGGELCRALAADEETRSIPTIILSASKEEVDRIVAFELGASDYVTRPYSLRELALRIGAILRRAKPEPEPSSVIDLGRLKIDRAAYKVWVDGREIELTLLELNLLTALYEGRNRVQTRSSLLGEVWGIDASITTRTVDTHVKRLRDKLGPLGEYVETVRGIGYRLALVKTEDQPHR